MSTVSTTETAPKSTWTKPIPIIYYKENCRRRAVKGAPEIEYRRSRDIVTSRAEYAAFRARQERREAYQARQTMTRGLDREEAAAAKENDRDDGGNDVEIKGGNQHHQQVHGGGGGDGEPESRHDDADALAKEVNHSLNHSSAQISLPQHPHRISLASLASSLGIHPSKLRACVVELLRHSQQGGGSDSDCITTCNHRVKDECRVKLPVVDAQVEASRQGTSSRSTVHPSELQPLWAQSAVDPQSFSSPTTIVPIAATGHCCRPSCKTSGLINLVIPSSSSEGGAESIDMRATRLGQANEQAHEAGLSNLQLASHAMGSSSTQASAAQSKRLRSMTISTTDSPSTEIIVDSGKSINGNRRSCWFQADLEPGSAKSQLTSFSQNLEEAEWMKEQPQDTVAYDRPRQLNLGRWKYTVPTGKPKSPPSQKSSSIISSTKRRAKADVQASDRRISKAPHASHDYILRPKSHAESAVKLEEGEIPANSEEIKTVIKVTVTPESKKRARGVYVPPHQRDRKNRDTHQPVIVERTPDEAGFAENSPNQDLTSPSQLQESPSITDNTQTAITTPDFSYNRTFDEASPCNRKQTPIMDLHDGGRPSSSVNIDPSPPSAWRNDDLLRVLKGIGIEEHSADMKSITEIVQNHQSAQSTKNVVVDSDDALVTGENSQQQDPPRQYGLQEQGISAKDTLTLDTDAILARPRKSPHEILRQSSNFAPTRTAIQETSATSERSEKTMTPSPLSQKHPQAERSAIETTNGDDERPVTSQIVTEQPSEASKIVSKGPHRIASEKGTRAMQKKSDGGNLENRVVHKGKEKASNQDQADNGISLHFKEDWHSRPLYHNPDERNAVARAFAAEQAENLPDHHEAVDVTSREFQLGLPILAEDEEDVRVEKDRDNQEPRKADDSGKMLPLPSQKTSNDHAESHMHSFLRDHPLASLLVDHKAEFRKMSKEEKRQIREFCNRPNPHAPKADIYLRPAETGDAKQINDIWNYHLRETISVGCSDPWTPASWLPLIRQDTGPRMPFLVAVLKHGKKTKREKNEHIIGFGRGLAHGDETNAYRFSVELEVFVRNQSLHLGVGKSLFDRLMASVAGNPYHTKGCAPLIGVDDPYQYSDGMFWRSHTIVVSVFHDGADDPTLKWKDDFLAANNFQKAGCIAKYGYKFGKFYDMSQYYFHTYIQI